MTQPAKQTISTVARAFLAMYFVGASAWQATAQEYCTSDEPAHQLTYLLVNEQDLPIGTAFPIDDRGLFITAKHLVQYNNIGELRLSNKRYFHDFAFSLVSAGAYNTTDIFNPYIYDDWAIIKADIGDKSVVPFKFRADDINNLDIVALAAHSPIGSHPAQSQMPFASTSAVPCTATDIMVLSLAEYQKGESGAPISEGRCVYGVTSRFDQEYLAFLDGIVDQQQAFQAIQAVVDQLNDSEGVLREDVLEAAMEASQDPELIACMTGSEIQCAAQHIDAFRELMASLQRVVVTPLSCVSDSVFRAAFSSTTSNDIISFKASPPSEIDNILAFPISNDKDLVEFARKIAGVRTVREKWSWISFLQLLDKVSKLDFSNFYNKESARSVLRDAVGLISKEHGMVNLLQQFRDMDADIKAEQRNDLENQRLALQARLDALSAQQVQVSSAISALSQQTGVTPNGFPPSIAPPPPNPQLKAALEARQGIFEAISEVQGQVDTLTSGMEAISQSSEVFSDFETPLFASEIFSTTFEDGGERDRRIKEVLEQSIASEYPQEFYNPDTDYPDTVLSPYVMGPYSSGADVSNGQFQPSLEGAIEAPQVFEQ